MLKDYLNKRVTVLYETGYTYKQLKGIITKVTTNFIEVDKNTLISVNKIIKVILKEKE